MRKSTDRSLNKALVKGNGELSQGLNLTLFLKRTFIYQNQNSLNQFLRYVIVGGLASVVDISAFSIGTNIMGINHILSNTLSFMLGLVTNYLLSREWVFNKKIHNIKRDFFLFSLIGLVGLLISNIFLFILVDTGMLYFLLASSNDSLVKTVAKLTVIGIVLFWNFIARKKIVF
ncbi:MAG: GtrA family protein [Bacillota bacterium]